MTTFNPFLAQYLYRNRAQPKFHNLWLSGTMLISALISVYFTFTASINPNTLLYAILLLFYFLLAVVLLNLTFLPVGTAAFVAFLTCREIRSDAFHLMLLSTLSNKHLIKSLFNYTHQIVSGWCLISILLFGFFPLMLFLSILWTGVMRMGVALGVLLGIWIKETMFAIAGTAVIMILYVSVMWFSLIYTYETDLFTPIFILWNIVPYLTGFLCLRLAEHKIRPL